ncbi:MAG: hypothetical protein ABSF29_06110 [Tepidisphaeraceae bacterium]
MGKMGNGKTSGKFGDLVAAVRARWGTIAGRRGGGENPSSRLPCDLESVIRAIEAYPTADSGPSDPHPQTGITLGQLLDNFTQFRRLIVEEVTDELVRPIRLDEQLCLSTAIDHLLAAAVEQIVSSHYLRIEKAVEGQNAFLHRLGHDVRGQLNAILLTLQVLQRELSGVSGARQSLLELDQLRRTILTTIQQMDDVGGPPRQAIPRQPGSVHTV